MPPVCQDGNRIASSAGRTHDHDPAERNRHVRTVRRGVLDERYRSHPALWSGNPTFTHRRGLRPGPWRGTGRGSGEGADAIWLAQRGWSVTAADLSTVALQRGAAHAAQAGAAIAERISWLHADVMTWEPDPASYDWSRPSTCTCPH